MNEEEIEVLYYFDGLLCIIVGVGSGKIRVLIRKIVYLINVLGILFDYILVVIFINKVVLEMFERVK